MKLVASKNNFAISLAAALVSSVSLLAIEQANAACAPDPVANGGSVTCGDTTNQSGNFGFSSDPATGVTITVQSGATVSSTSNPGAGIHTTSGTIVNLGTITGRDSGVRASGGITITNSGAITGTNNVGVLADTGAANVTNAAGAKITGGTIGIDQSGGDATIHNAGQIESRAAANGIAIRANGDIALTIDNVVGGGIDADGQSGIAIQGKTITVTGNSGVIEAGIGAGITGGVAIDARTVGGTANVTNNSQGLIQASSIAIATDGLLTLNNAGAVVGAGTEAVLSNQGGVNIANTGLISAISSPGAIAIAAGANATVSNIGDGNTTGIITGNAFAIDGRKVNVGNTGLIEATDTAIVAFDGATVVNGSGGVIRANGLGQTHAMNVVGTLNVTNAGTIAAQSDLGDGITGQSIVLDNSGTIIAGSVAVESSGDISVANSGMIFATKLPGSAGNAFAGIAVDALGTATVSNTNLIQGVAQAVFGTDVVITGNSGTISATDPTGIAIRATQNATVTNLANGLITGPAGGILANTVAVTGNDGTIEANGPNGIAIKATGDADITNSSTIRAAGAGGIALAAGGATVANAATGTIAGNAIAIAAPTINITSNAGAIEATADANTLTGFAIFGNAVTIGANSGRIQETGIGGRAINAGSATVNNLAGGSIIADGTNGVAISIAGGPANITNAGTIRAANGMAISADGLATVANLSGGVINGGTSGIAANTLDVTNAGTITGGANAIQGSGTVRNAGTIQGGTASVAFNGGAGVTNQLILQTGSQLIGDASGSTAGATNQFILQGHGTADTNFINFNTLDVQADTAWVWNTTATITGGTTISSGVLAVDGILNSPTMVSAGGALAGRGTLNGDVTVASGGAVAPGAVMPFSTLTVGGNVAFNAGSIYRVNINAAGQNDKLIAGTATLTGGTVSVLTQGGVLLGTPYTILTANGGLGGTQFSGVSGSSGFLSPTLTYDANDVFLTFAGAGTNGTVGFASAALTPNQVAVATALDASPTNNSLVGRLLALTIEGARAAFDALSGELFGTVQNAQNETASFTRSGVLGRLRQASYADAPGELGALGFAGPELAYAGEAGAGYAAAGTAAYAADANGVPMKAPRGGNQNGRDLTFWAQGLGGWGHTGSDGNAASLTSRFGGFLSGADMRFGEMWRAGLVAGYTRTDLNVDDRLSSGGIDSVIVGAYAGGKLGAVNVRGGGTYSYDRIDTSRTIAFPGLTDSTHAHFHGSVGQLFGEVGYGFAMGNVALEPFAGLAYVHVQDGSFQENGGLAALSASSAHENLGYSTLGLRAATIIPLANGTALVPRGSLQWQHAFGDVTPTTGLAFQSTGTAFTVAGLPIARDAALVEGGFDWRLSPWAKLGAFYQGDLAAHAQAHAVKGTFTWDF